MVSQKINELVEILKTEFPKLKFLIKKGRNLCQKEGHWISLKQKN